MTEMFRGDQFIKPLKKYLGAKKENVAHVFKGKSFNFIEMGKMREAIQAFPSFLGLEDRGHTNLIIKKEEMYSFLKHVQ